VLTSASLTHKLNLGGVHVEEGTNVVNMILLATDHGDELTVLGANITTGDGRVNAVDAEILGLVSHAHVERWAGSSVVDEERALLHVSEETVLFVEDHGLNVTGVSEHNEEVISLLGDLNWRHESSSLLDEGVASSLEAIRNLKGQLTFSHEVAGHGFAHDTGSDPTNLRAFKSLCPLGQCWIRPPSIE